MIFDRTCISKYSGHISQTGHAAKTAEWYSLGNWMEDLGHAARAYKRYFELPLQKSQLGRNPMFKKMVTTSVIASTAIVTAAMLFITIFSKNSYAYTFCSRGKYVNYLHCARENSYGNIINRCNKSVKIGIAKGHGRKHPTEIHGLGTANTASRILHTRGIGPITYWAFRCE